MLREGKSSTSTEKICLGKEQPVLVLKRSDHRRNGLEKSSGDMEMIGVAHIGSDTERPCFEKRRVEEKSEGSEGIRLSKNWKSADLKSSASKGKERE